MVKKLLIFLAAVPTVLFVGSLFATSVSADTLNDLGYPFAPGETWYVYEGYNIGSHTGNLAYAFDLTQQSATYQDTPAVDIFAPIAGTVTSQGRVRLCYDGNVSVTTIAVSASCSGTYYINWGEQINIQFANGTVSLEHIDGIVNAGDTVVKGQKIGTLFQGHPGGPNHLHFQIIGDYLNYGVWHFPGANPNPGQNGAYAGTAIVVPPLKVVYPNVTAISISSQPNKVLEAYADRTTGAVYYRVKDMANFTTCVGWTNGGGSADGQVTLIEYNNELYQIIRGKGSNTLWMRKSTNGTSWGDWWNETQPAFSNVSAVVFNNALYMSVQAANNQIYYKAFTGTIGITGWTATTNAGATKGDPSLFVSGTTMFQSIRGLNDDFWSRTMVGTSTTWNDWSPAAGGIGSNINTAEFNGKLYQAIVGLDGQVYQRNTTPNFWSSWNNTGGGSGATNAVLAVYNSLLYETVRGADNQVWFRSLDTSGNWSGWQNYAGTTYSDVTLLPAGGKLLMMIYGTDGNVWHRALTGTTWGAWSGC